MVNGTRVTVTDELPVKHDQSSDWKRRQRCRRHRLHRQHAVRHTAGGGCSHGVSNSTNGVFRVSANGHITEIANLSAFQKANPTAHEKADDFEPDGTWYSMIAVRGALYAVEPNHGELDKITTSGSISRIADISASYGHIVPTAMTYRGNFYVGNLNTFPIVSGSSKIIKINPAGQMQTVVWG